MFTIRRNKYGRVMHATALTGTLVTGWHADPAAAKQLDEVTARNVVEAHKAKNSPNGGQIAALDANGKMIAMWGEIGEEPVKPKPVASLPDLAARITLVEERVEMIEAADGKVIAERITLQFTADEASALKGMLGEWAAHKKSQVEKEKLDQKEQQVRGGNKTPAPAG
jgi:hypothetical protein